MYHTNSLWQGKMQGWCIAADIKYTAQETVFRRCTHHSFRFIHSSTTKKGQGALYYCSRGVFQCFLLPTTNTHIILRRSSNRFPWGRKRLYRQKLGFMWPASPITPEKFWTRGKRFHDDFQNAEVPVFFNSVLGQTVCSSLCGSLPFEHHSCFSFLYAPFWSNTPGSRTLETS